MAITPTFPPGTWILRAEPTQDNTTAFCYSIARPATIDAELLQTFLTWNDPLLRRWRFRIITVLGDLFTRMQYYHGKQFVFHAYLFITYHSSRLPSNLFLFRRISYPFVESFIIPSNHCSFRQVSALSVESSLVPLHLLVSSSLLSTKIPIPPSQHMARKLTRYSQDFAQKWLHHPLNKTTSPASEKHFAQTAFLQDRLACG